MSETTIKTVVTKEEEMKKIFKSFQTNLDSLKSFVDTLSPIAFEKDSNRSEEITKVLTEAFEKVGIELSKVKENESVTTQFVEEEPKEVEETKVKQKNDVEEKTENIKEESPKREPLTKEQLAFLANQLRKLPKISVGHSRILYQSSFVLLVSYFEYLFADLLKFYHKHYPGNISDKPIQVVINELKSYETIEEAIDYVISKEVEILLFDLSFNELIEFFNKNLKINLESDLINETRERRHIIVHNNSIINKKYLSKSKMDFLPDKEDLKIGEKINVKQDYFNFAFNEIYSAGHLLLFNCWRQWLKSDTLNIYTEIMSTTFECLKQDLNDIACCISLYSTNIDAKTDKEFDYLLRAKFNYFVALKQLNKNDDLDKQLSQVKISTLSPTFKMAYYALKNDKEKLLETIPHCKLVDEMKIEWLQEWPLFKHFRLDIEFYKQLEEKYNAS